MELQKIGDFENVFYDGNSTNDFEKLNEKDFIINLFFCLKVEFKEIFSAYDFYVFSTNNPSVLPSIIDNNIDSKRSLLFYISEESGFIPYILTPFFKAIFKSYMSYEPGCNIYSFALGHINKVIFSQVNLPPISERKINIFFSGNLQRNRIDLYRQYNLLRYVPLAFLPLIVRRPFKQIITKLFGKDYSSPELNTIIRFTDGFMNGYSKEEYKNYLIDTKILLCPKGYLSTETFRLFEGLNAGCVVVSERLPKLEIYKNVPVLQVDSWKEGLKKCEDLLLNEVLLNQLQEEGILWWQNNYSYSSIAKRIVKEVYS